jgi:hypothetical protein
VDVLDAAALLIIRHSRLQAADRAAHFGGGSAMNVFCPTMIRHEPLRFSSLQQVEPKNPKQDPPLQPTG